MILSILCVSAHSSVSNLGCTYVVRIRQRSSESTDKKVWIKSIWYIQEKFCFQKDVVVAGSFIIYDSLFFDPGEPSSDENEACLELGKNGKIGNVPCDGGNDGRVGICSVDQYAW